MGCEQSRSATQVGGQLEVGFGGPTSNASIVKIAHRESPAKLNRDWASIQISSAQTKDSESGLTSPIKYPFPNNLPENYNLSSMQEDSAKTLKTEDCTVSSYIILKFL